MVIKPPEVASVYKTEGESPIPFLNLIDPFILKEFDRKNKKKKENKQVRYTMSLY